MGDIRCVIPQLLEPDRTIAETLVQFYEQMKSLDKLTNPNEKAGKKATAIVMAINDIKRAYN